LETWSKDRKSASRTVIVNGNYDERYIHESIECPTSGAPPSPKIDNMDKIITVPYTGVI